MTSAAVGPIDLPAPPDPDAHDEPVLLGSPTDAQITDQLLGVVLRPPRWMPYALTVTGLGTLVLFTAVTYTVLTGIGVWGNNIPVAWAFAITNFVWWIGIGHAGTFISAFLLLLEQKWRTSINRFAEAMTLFAIVQAGLFPLLHLGRPWFAYWLIPYPSEMQVWPQFRSSLTWDVAAVTTYFTVSLLFWYLGLVPDVAAMRDRAPERWRRRIYGVLALGWYGSAQQWHRYRIAYGLLGGLATPLVVSVHSIVSMDFAISQLPGWHSLIFPPYFVGGAIFSGFAMVLTLMLPARKLYRLENVITTNHLDNMGKMMLLTGWVVFYAYACEWYMAWYTGDPFEIYANITAKVEGPYAPVWWIVFFCNCLSPQILWSKRVRTSPVPLWIVTIFIQIGMWLERYMLIVMSENRDFLPSSWRMYRPSAIDLTILGGTICFFLFLFLLLIRFLPFIPISELKEMRRHLVEEAAEAEGDPNRIREALRRVHA
jgi:molybdopterin-containing oxidoreductase family membrane subunit